MSAGSAFAAFVAVVAAVVAVTYYVAGVRVRRASEHPEDTGASSGLLRELTDQLQAARAEAAHWQRTAQRLQAELDRRGDAAGGDSSSVSG